jgi:hypothetical protein
LIGEGLASLYLLSLDGCPAADATPAVGRLWTADLWNSQRRDWHMEADGPCIRSAFETLRQTCHRWPSPAKFWEVLPSRKPPEDTLLPARVFTLEERRENLKRLAKISEQLLGGAKHEDAAS